MKRSLRKKVERGERKRRLIEPPDRYHEWLECFFGRIRPGFDPWADGDGFEFDAPGQQLLQLLEYTMLHCGRDLSRFTDQQLGFGLNAMLMGNYSNLPHDLIKAQVDPADKLGAVRSIKFLYSDCLSRRAPPVLGHLSETSENPLASLTYMLWDVSALKAWIGVRNEVTGRSALVETLGDVLALPKPNPACIESVLHGFNHMVFAHPKHRDQIIGLIDDLIRTSPLGRPELLQYAEWAKTGRLQ